MAIDMYDNLDPPEDIPSVSKTDSGYWHVRWNANQWIQWPIGRQAELTDAFGWVDQQMVEEANRLTTDTAKGGAE